MVNPISGRWISEPWRECCGATGERMNTKQISLFGNNRSVALRRNEGYAVGRFIGAVLRVPSCIRVAMHLRGSGQCRGSHRHRFAGPPHNLHSKRIALGCFREGRFALYSYTYRSEGGGVSSVRDKVLLNGFARSAEKFWRGGRQLFPTQEVCQRQHLPTFLVKFFSGNAALPVAL